MRDVGDYDEHTLVMTCHEEDDAARQAVATLKEQLVDSNQLRWAPYQEIVAACRRYQELDGWADHFTQRYLDLSVVTHGAGSP